MSNNALTRANAGATFTTGQLLTTQDVLRMQNGARQVAIELLIGRLYLSGGALPTGFFGTDCLASSSGGLNYSVAPGLGLQLDTTITEAFTSQLRPIVVGAAITGTLGARDATNPRIDILCLKADYDTDTSESINVMAGDGSTSASTADRRSLYSYAFQVVAGTPAGSPVAPATPTGYIKIAQCAVPALSGSIVVTDYRPLLVLDSAAIGVGAVDTEQLAAAAVTTAKIEDGTITAVKMNMVPVYCSMTANAESSNTITIDVQVVDLDGNPKASIYYLEFSLANTTHQIMDGADYYLTIGAAGNRVVETHDSSPAVGPYALVTTNSSGVCNIVIHDAVTGTNRGVRLIAQVMGGYGPRKYIQAPFN